MFKSPIAIIIVVCALIVGGVVVYQYFGMPKEKNETPGTIKPPGAGAILENETAKEPGAVPTPPPKNETADWKTYRNEEYGFEISYPGNWYLHLEQNQPLFVKKEPSMPPVELEAYGEQVGIWITEGMINPFTKTLFVSRKEWISWYEDYFQNPNRSREKEWQTINGIEVLRIKTRSPHASYDFLYYIIFKEDKVYSLHLYPYNKTDPVYSKNIEIFDTMLSTFKFLD